MFTNCEINFLISKKLKTNLNTLPNITFDIVYDYKIKLSNEIFKIYPDIKINKLNDYNLRPRIIILIW